MAWEIVGNIRGVQGPPGNLDRGQIPAGSNLNSFYGPASVGSYGVPLQSNVDGLVNAPPGAKPGTFTVFPVGSTASTQIWTEYLAPGRMFVSGVSQSGRTAPWKDVFAADDGGNFALSGYATFSDIDKTSNYSVWNGAAATAAGAPVGLTGEIKTYLFGTAGIQTYTTSSPVLGAQVFTRGKGSQGWGEFKELTNQPGTATSEAPPVAGFKNAYLALNQPATGGTESVSAATVRWPLKTGVASKRARLHVRNWNWVNGTTFGGASFTGAWMGQATAGNFTGTPNRVVPAFTLPSNGSEYVSAWFSYDLAADVQHLLSVGFTTPAGQANQSSRGGCYRSTNAADASLASGFGGAVSTTSPFDVWLELEVPAATPIVAGFGDSNTVGTGTALPVYDSWLNQYARTAKAIPYFSAVHGSTSGNWKTATGSMWGRTPGQARPDAVINFLGQNDLVEGVTLATLQDNFNAILPILKSKLAAEVYVATISPADAKSSAVNTTRRAYNTWLKTLPGGVKDVFDFSAAVSDNDLTIRVSDNSDGIHFLTSGHAKIAAKLLAGSVVPPPLSVGPAGADGADGVGVPAGGSALQVIRKNVAGAAAEWVTPDRVMVGLENVDNTSDAAKPVSEQAQLALDAKLGTATRGAASGVAPLDADAKVPEGNIPERLGATALSSKITTEAIAKDKIYRLGADRGMVESSTVNQAAKFQQLIDDSINRIAMVGKGTYLIDGALISNPMQLGCLGSPFARFPTNGIYNGTQLNRVAGATAPMLTVDSHAVTLDENLVFNGAGGSNLGLFVKKGFQYREIHANFISFASTAVEYAYMANAVVEDTFVDNSGSLTKPAVYIRSDGVGARTNNFRLNRLTIERSQNTALAIATVPSGETPDIDKHWAEWLFFDGIHIEAALDNGGLANTAPAIDIGNVRNVSFSGGQVYGGPGPLLKHEQTLNRTYGNGGIVLNGGFWLGSDVGAGAAPTPYLIDLVAGDNFTLTGGAVLDRYTVAAVRIGASYGPNVTIDPSVLATGVLIEDNRPLANRKPYTVTGDLRINGHIKSAGLIPTAASVSGTGAGLNLAAASNDIRGTLKFGSGSDTTKTLAGMQLGEITFRTSYVSQPVVMLIAKNLASRQIGEPVIAVNSTGTGFKLYAPANLPANQGASTYEYDYLVVG